VLAFLDNSGVIASAGAGVSLSVQNYLWLGAYAGWRFPIIDPLASTYYSKPSGFFWGITFAAHYLGKPKHQKIIDQKGQSIAVFGSPIRASM